MSKVKRIKYGIKKLKKAGFSYIAIGQKISGGKKATKKYNRLPEMPKVSSSSASSSTKAVKFKYLINLIKKLYVWFKKHFQKKV